MKSPFNTPYRYIPVASPVFWAVRRQYRILRHRGEAVHCPVCTRSFSGWIGHSELGLCPDCGSGARHRMLWLFLEAKTRVLTEPVRILHFAPAPCLTRRFRQLLHAEYVTTDLSAPGVDVKSDITDLAIYDASFDVIVNSHVLEHVSDDRAAMRQLHRVLRPGGLLFLQVPYNRNDPTDEDLALTDPAERTRRFGQFDHVRRYGTDLVDRLSQAGFHVDLRLPMTEMDEAQARRLGLWNDVLFLCARDDDPTAGVRLLKT